MVADREDQWVTDGGQPVGSVSAELFTPSGKWKYSVLLDYTGIYHKPVSVDGVRDKSIPWTLDVGRAAELALAAATDRGTSGVSIRELGDYWTLVVPDPPNGWPVLVRHG